MKKLRPSYKPPTPEEEEKIKRNLEENPLTNKDYFAMFIAMMITLLPRVLLILGIVVFVLWYFFIR